tara:strand:- start:13 stop:843 length:831 start_codon:yes stop_codon:yes gene_type:complete
MSSVANYNIEDNSGANVRIDLNAVLAAIQSSNSDSSDLADSQCVAGMWFLRSDNNTLKIRGSGSNFTTVGNIDQTNLGLLPRSGGTSAPMTGQFLADDSNSASAPAISFDTDTDLGLFRKSSNVMGFSSSGVEQMVFDANGITLRTRNEIRFGDNDSSNYVGIQAPLTVSQNRTITLPDETGTLVTSASIVSQVGAQNLTGLRTLTPNANNTFDLGSTSLRWANLYVNDLDLSNEGKQNDVDGTWGSYTIQEGEEHLYLLNRRNGKKYKFNLTEIE